MNSDKANCVFCLRSHPSRLLTPKKTKPCEISKICDRLKFVNLLLIMPPEFITVKGAKLHNLKNVDVKIPKNKLTVITGVSGSGKSSLAFDTI